MLRRPLVLLLSLALAVVLAGGALAANVKVRVEGKTQTIYGSSQPGLRADNALQALDVASVAGEFHYALTTSSFGDYVSQIGKYAAAENTGWAFKVNGVSPPVGADKVVLKDGDVVLWYYATFGPTGGPPTLDLKRLPGNCYVVETVDDAGKRARAAQRDTDRREEASPGTAGPRLHRRAHGARPRGRRRRHPLERGSVRCGASPALSSSCSSSPAAAAAPARGRGPHSSGSRATAVRRCCWRPRSTRARP